MRKLDELIAEGEDIIRDLRGHLRDPDHLLVTHWDTLEDWYRACRDYVQQCSPHNFDRIKPLNVLDNETTHYGVIDGLLKILRAVRAAGRGAGPVAPIPASQLPGGPEPAPRDRGMFGPPLKLLRDPVWQGLGVLVAIAIALLGYVLAT